MKTWLIAGASSGVGKTTLVQDLVKVLPDAEFLKVGHGRRKKKGPTNFFTSADEGLSFIESLKGKCEHCVIESNRLVGILKADIVIFLDRDGSDRRTDAGTLRKSADIILGQDGNDDDWKSKLRALKLSSGLAGKLLDIFQSQHEFLLEKKMSMRSKVWFGIDGLVVFGEGLARLLSGIDKLGSLSRAAVEEDISYRHAWGDIKRAEERLGFQLLERQTGGSSGGGSRLTKKGRRLLEGYNQLKRRMIRESNRWFNELSEEIYGDD